MFVFDVGAVILPLESISDTYMKFTLNKTGKGPLSSEWAPFLSCYPCSVLHVGSRFLSLALASDHAKLRHS